MHSDAAWTWFSRQEDNRFFFCRFTQLGLLRLLATSAVMGKDVRTIGEACDCYLLAVSQGTDATLVTFDRGLASACHKARQRVTLLEPRAVAGG